MTETSTCVRGRALPGVLALATLTGIACGSVDPDSPPDATVDGVMADALIDVPDVPVPADERLAVLTFCGAGGAVTGSHHGELCFGVSDLAASEAQNTQFIWQPGPMQLITP